MKLPFEWFILMELVDVGIAELLTQEEADACRFKCRERERIRPQPAMKATRIVAAGQLAAFRQHIGLNRTLGVVWERPHVPLEGYVAGRAS